jgi:hypothetical protein
MRRLSAALTAALTLLVLTSPAPASADRQDRVAAYSPVSFALLGDTPYSASERNDFPALRQAINGAAGVRLVLHAGDIKSGSSACTNWVYEDRQQLFNGFADPFVLTPGDNEWTDCHTEGAGQYVPTERLAQLRQVLFAGPHTTLGQRQMTVHTQADSAVHSTYRENVRFRRAGVVFATVHVVGSANDRQPWSGLVGGDRPAERTAEYQARDAAALAWIDAAFDRAADTSAPGVVLMMQAEPTDGAAYQTIRNKIVARADSFNKPVLLMHGDEHSYEAEPGYAGVSNLTRLETFGTTTSKWLRVKVDPSSSTVFSWKERTVS